MSRHLLSLLFILLALGPLPVALYAQAISFPKPAGLRDAVDFWKKVFTRHGYGEVILFDPLDPATIYSVLRVPEGEAGRALVGKERARIAAAYDLVDEERIRGQRGAKEPFSDGLRISGRYIVQMQKIFREQGLPAELAYLPLVESSFNVRARSGAGAVGIWQFIPETGRKFMRIDDQVDERRDPLTSTRAAARLLQENYRILGSWPLAITAYNHGTEGIFRAIDSVGSRDLVELIRRYQAPAFGFASKNFYAEFLAAVEIAAQREKHFPFLRLHSPVALREMEVKKATSVEALLKPAAISRSDFLQWNPALADGTKVIPAGYRVKLPAEKVPAFLTAQTRVSATPIKFLPGVARKGEAKSLAGPRPPTSVTTNANAKNLRVAASTSAKDPVAARTKEQVVNDLIARRSVVVAAR